MKRKMVRWLVSGMAGIGMVAMAETAQDSPRKGLGHGECIHESCQGEGRQTMTRERQGQRRGQRDGQGPGKGLNRGQGQGQQRGQGQGQGQGQFRQGEGQRQGWHRDGTGARK